jgi:hypothetical protein
MQTLTQKEVKCESGKVKVGSVLSNTMYLTVKKVHPGKNVLSVQDQNGLEFEVQGKDLIEAMYSADQFSETKTVNMTEAATILENAGDTVFMCAFNKKADENTVAEALGSLSVAELTTPKTLKKHLKSILQGEERVLTGHLLNSEAKLGRSQVIDLNIPKGEYNIRLVDHRSLNWIIFKNIKYIVK